MGQIYLQQEISLKKDYLNYKQLQIRQGRGKPTLFDMSEICIIIEARVEPKKIGSAQI